MSLRRGPLRPQALLIALASLSCVVTPTKITIHFRVDQDLYRPEYLLVTWLAPDERTRVGLRVPADGLLAASGPDLGTMVIDMGGAPAGERKIIVWGMRGLTQVSGATGVVSWLPDDSQELSLTLGCVQKVERPPLEGRADSAPWVECSEVPPAAPMLPPDGGLPADAAPVPPDGPRDDAADAGLPADASPDRGADAAAPDAPTPDALPPPPPPPPPPDVDAAPPPPDVAGPEVLPPGADLAKGLVVYLKLDDGRGSPIAADLSGNGNTGTLVQLDILSAWVSGYLGTALNTGNGWVSIPESVSLDGITNGLSISAWINRTGDGTIASRRAVGSSGFLYRLFISGGQLGFQINSTNGARADFLGTAPVPPGQWVHVAAAYDKQIARVFLRGASVGEQVYQLGIGPENSPLLIGAREDATLINADDRFQGQIDEVAVYNRGLSDVEVQALAAGFLPK